MFRSFFIVIVIAIAGSFSAVKIYQYHAARKLKTTPVPSVTSVTEQTVVIPVSSGVVVTTSSGVLVQGQPVSQEPATGVALTPGEPAAISTSSGVLMQGQQGSTATVSVTPGQTAVVSTSSGVLAQGQQMQQASTTKLPGEKPVPKNIHVVTQKTHPQFKNNIKMPKKAGARTTLITTKPQPKNVFAAKEKFGEPWVAVGYGQYYINNPKFKIGSKAENDSTPLITNNNDGWTDMYNLEVEYQFNRPDNMFRKLFGDHPTVSLVTDYESPHSSSEAAVSDNGELYTIDGHLILPGGSKQLDNSLLKAKDTFTNFGLYLSGLHKTRWNRFSFDPYVGLVYSQDKDEYDFSSTYHEPNTASDEENYRLKTKYYGVSGGSQLNYQLSRTLTAFLDIQLQLLHAEANLDANQTYDIGTPLPSNLSLSDNDHRAVTYKGMLAGGFNYHFINSPNSVALNLIGGVHHYGYAAEIVTPHHEGDSPVHLKGDNIDDMFVMAQLAVPLPFLT